jgi:DNA replication and repair protein RecF
MRLNNLRLRGFRNYEELDADFVPGVNLILGDNAQGKTNLLEAICYLSTGHGFRTRREAELIRFGAGFADLEARVYTAERDQTLRAVLYPGRKPRQLWLNGVRQKSFQNLSGLLTTVQEK